MALACMGHTLWPQVSTFHQSVASGDCLSNLHFSWKLLSLPSKQCLPLSSGSSMAVVMHLNSATQTRFCTEF